MAMRVFVGTRVGSGLKQLSAGQFDLFQSPIDDHGDAFAAFEVGKNEGPGSAHLAAIAIHYFQGSSYVRCKIDLI